ncbi:MAG: hypothetical protein Q7K29_05860 [Thermoleophilia bacterium]|nr:hypothetical protein [Thermoleophilia bacterium]
MARTMLERYMEKNYGIYDKFQHSLDKSYMLDGGKCHYCSQRLTTDPFETGWDLDLAHFHHDARGKVVTVCKGCHRQIHQ